MLETLSISSKSQKEVINLTDQINLLIKKHKIREGVLTATVLHTTCCLTTGEVGEGTDQDLLEVAQKMIPDISFRHAHNPSHAPSHMTSSIIGPSLSLLIENGELALGTWQSVLLLELDGPRQRNIKVAFIPLGLVRQ